MKFKDFYTVLARHKYYIFTYEDVLSFFTEEKRLNLRKMIYRWNKKGWIYALKRGLYELTYPVSFNIPDLYVANKIYNPSYVSLETALSNYSIIPEVSMSVTSITTKPTRRFKNNHGLFTYRTVNTNAFVGYYVEKHGIYDILIAEPEKALIDYLYFKRYRNNEFDLKEERLDRDVISGLKKNKLNKYAKLYNLNLKEFYAYL
ncbi:MAG: hypothetical protein ABH862_02170 [Candidatus Omnitrophota bacterium]